ncbi:MAG: hypothetical protein E6I75_21460 [Chloroflexi bacterium]|nr:MAG: hypothetical protein E6I75_21460 [Chloroflexota bacterium]
MSKWNSIEHRLFSQISRNWAGMPLRTWETLLAFIRGTATTTGLVVRAAFQPGDYPKGQKVSDADMDALNIEPHATLPMWNCPRLARAGASPRTAAVLHPG